jgi:hypothetical protein
VDNPGYKEGKSCGAIKEGKKERKSLTLRLICDISDTRRSHEGSDF